MAGNLDDLIFSLADPTPEELRALRITIAVLGTISVVLGLIVVLTYACFPEKRKSNTSILIFFHSIVGTALTASIMIPGYFGEYLEPETGLCYFQAGCFLFFGMCLMFAWFFITLNLFLRVHLDKEEVPLWIPLSVSLLAATLVTIIPFATGNVKYDGVWCFIDSVNLGMVFGCFYGELIALTAIGTPLWIVIIWKMTSSLMATWETQRKTPINENRHLLHVDNPPPTVGQKEKLLLLVRQTTFVTGFLIIFYIMVANRLIIFSTGPTFVGWLIHAIGLSSPLSALASPIPE